jgi:hypothetical protein
LLQEGNLLLVLQTPNSQKRTTRDMAKKTTTLPPYELAEKIHGLLAQDAAACHSQDDATCALRIATALWIKSPKVFDYATQQSS